ncbi:hypothetical protein DL93DRAFT_2230903 [Clavulina sp. PMI_390]|nr:hypothetical protein DL93DRAFT_2230903 [Clavulina sp. PMI_390]
MTLPNSEDEGEHDRGPPATREDREAGTPQRERSSARDESETTTAKRINKKSGTEGTAMDIDPRVDTEESLCKDPTVVSPGLNGNPPNVLNFDRMLSLAFRGYGHLPCDMMSGSQWQLGLGIPRQRDDAIGETLFQWMWKKWEANPSLAMNILMRPTDYARFSTPPVREWGPSFFHSYPVMDWVHQVGEAALGSASGGVRSLCRIP